LFSDWRLRYSLVATIDKTYSQYLALSWTVMEQNQEGKIPYYDQTQTPNFTEIII